MINQEEIYRLLREEKWNELIDIFYKKKDLIHSDVLLKQSLEISLNEIVEKTKKENTDKCFLNALETIWLLDSGKFIKLNDNQREAFIVAIALGSKETLEKSYQFAKLCPENEICKSIINEFEKSNPIKINHSQSNTIEIVVNNEINDVDFSKTLFNSSQEVEFFIALKRVFSTFQIYPNVALSSIFEFEKVKDFLSSKEKDFFLKTTIDFVVFEPFRNYFPLYCFEIDSIWHDTKEQKEKDLIKDKIFSISGKKLFRIRKRKESIDEIEFENLLIEIREMIKQ